MLIRGIKKHDTTSVSDGLAAQQNFPENNNNLKSNPSRENNDIESNKIRKSENCYITTSRLPVLETCAEDTASPMILRAASLVLALLEVRKSVLNGEIEQDMHKGQPQTMQWYNYVFSSGLVFHSECIERYRAPTEYSRHIVVLIGGAMYKVEVLRSDNMGQEIMPSFAEIKVRCHQNYIISLNFMMTQECLLDKSLQPRIFYMQLLYNMYNSEQHPFNTVHTNCHSIYESAHLSLFVIQ